MAMIERGKSGTAYIDTLDLGQVGRSDEHDVGRELGRAQNFERLRLDVENGHETLPVDVPDGFELRSVHGVVVRAVLEVFVVGNVAHHLFVCDEEVVLAVFLVFFRKTRGV